MLLMPVYTAFGPLGRPESRIGAVSFAGEPVCRVGVAVVRWAFD